MSEELKRAQARQRLKRVIEREQAKLPNIEPGASNQAFEIVQTTKSEELLSKEELRRLLFTIIKDSEQVDNIMNDMNIVTDESAPLLVENFKKMVADLKSTYKSGVAFPQLKGFIKRYADKLLKQVTPDQNITYQTGAVEEVNNLRSLIARGELLTRGQVNEQTRELISRLASRNNDLLANKREVERLQKLIADGVLVPSSVVNQREQRLLEEFSQSNSEQISNIVREAVKLGAISTDISEPVELTDRDLRRLNELKPYTEKDVKPIIKKLSRDDKAILSINLNNILTNTLGPNRSDIINEILDSFNKGLSNPIKTLSKKLQDDAPVTLGEMINPTAPLVTEWRNRKMNELMKDPQYQRNPQNIKPMIEEMSKQMFGYGIKKKKQ